MTRGKPTARQWLTILLIYAALALLVLFPEMVFPVLDLFVGRRKS